MLRWIRQRPMAILAVALTAWAGSGQPADVAGGYRTLDERTMGSARGSNPAWTGITPAVDCADYNRTAGTNQVGALACEVKDANGNYINRALPCVNCSATLAAWPLPVNVQSGALSPMQASPNGPQNCGNKTVGVCDKNGDCSNAAVVPGDAVCNPVTPAVPQPVKTKPTPPQSQ